VETHQTIFHFDTLTYQRISLKLISCSRITVILLLLLLPASCGYHNPYVYRGPDKSVYIATWKNRTNQLQIGIQIYQSLVTWYEKSRSITVTKQEGNADLILTGEILSINIPSLAYGANNAAVQVKIYIDVRYLLKDAKTGKVLMEVPRQSLSESYYITSDISSTNDNEKKAINLMIDDLSERIYLNTISQLQHQ